MRKARSAINFVGLAAIVCLFAGCAENQQMKQQLAEMQAQVNELQTTLADLNLRMEEMNSSLFVLRETTKANRDAVKKLQQEMNSPTVYIDQPPEPALPSAPAAPPKTAMAPPPQVSDADKTLPPLPLPAGSGKAPADEEKAFQSAMTQVDRQNWGLAVYDLNAFVAQHPTSAYLPRARYALGESYRRLSEYAQAAREYERCVAAGEAAGPYAARALFWLAQCYQQLGQTEKAKQAQNRLQQEYPNSPEAKKSQMDASR